MMRIMSASMHINGQHNELAKVGMQCEMLVSMEKDGAIVASFYLECTSTFRS